MLKMERGAAGAAGRKANVEDLNQWRQARGSTASSARPRSRAENYGARGQDWDPEWNPNGPAFWEEDDPWRQTGGKRQERAENRRSETDLWKQAWRDATEIPDREYRARPSSAGSRPIREDSRRQPQRGGADCYRTARGERPESQEFCRQQWQSDRRRFDTDPRGREDRPLRKDPRPAPGRTRERSGNRNGLLLLMALLGFLAIAAIIGLNVFQIRTIGVKGNDTVSAQSIIALSGISAGENILKANLVQAKKNIESDPLLQVVSIQRVFPDEISIQVHERIPHGAIAYLGGYVIIDENGIVLDYRSSLPAGQYPLITGVEIKPSEKGKPVQGVDGVQQKTMYGLLSALYNNNAMQYVSEADLGNGGDIWLLTGEGLQIDLGKPTDLDRKAQLIAGSIPTLRNSGHTSGVLYATGTEDPIYSPDASGRVDATGSGTSPGQTVPQQGASAGAAGSAGQGGNGNAA